MRRWGGLVLLSVLLFATPVAVAPPTSITAAGANTIEWVANSINGPVTVDYSDGAKNAKGFSGRGNPAPVSNSEGASSVWYALKQP